MRILFHNREFRQRLCCGDPVFRAGVLLGQLGPQVDVITCAPKYPTGSNISRLSERWLPRGRDGPSQGLASRPRCPTITCDRTLEFFLIFMVTGFAAWFVSAPPRCCGSPRHRNFFCRRGRWALGASRRRPVFLSSRSVARHRSSLGAMLPDSS